MIPRCLFFIGSYFLWRSLHICVRVRIKLKSRTSQPSKPAHTFEPVRLQHPKRVSTPYQIVHDRPEPEALKTVVLGEKTLHTLRRWATSSSRALPLQLKAASERMLLFFFHREQPPRYVVAQRSAMVESALCIDDGSLFARCVPGDTILRLSHNPTTPSDEIQSCGTSRIALHTDSGPITLPFRDSVGGLEIEGQTNLEPKSFLPLPPTDMVEIIINVNDTLTH